MTTTLSPLRLGFKPPILMVLLHKGQGSLSHDLLRRSHGVFRCTGVPLLSVMQLQSYVLHICTFIKALSRESLGGQTISEVGTPATAAYGGSR